MDTRSRNQEIRNRKCHAKLSELTVLKTKSGRPSTLSCKFVDTLKGVICKKVVSLAIRCVYTNSYISEDIGFKNLIPLSVKML